MLSVGLSYLVSLLLAPTVGALAHVAAFPLTMLGVKVGFPTHIQRTLHLLEGAAVGFTMGWFASVVFGWFGVEFGWLPLILLMIAALLNDMRRFTRAASTFGAYCEHVGATSPHEHREVATTDPQGQLLYQHAGTELAWLVGGLIGILVAGRWLL